MHQQLRSLLRKILDKENRKGNPQERSKFPKIFPKSQGVGNTPFKNKQYQHRAAANRDRHIMVKMGGESASPTNPEKGRTDKRRKKYADRLKDASAVYKSVQSHGPR